MISKDTRFVMRYVLPVLGYVTFVMILYGADVSRTVFWQVFGIMVLVEMLAYVDGVLAGADAEGRAWERTIKEALR